MKNYTKLADKHLGKNCVILGAGPSLYDLCVSDYFKDILDHVVISVNSAFMPLSKSNLNPEKHYWISNDTLVRRWSYWKDVEKSKCTKIVRDSWYKYRKVMNNTFFFSPRPTSESIVNFGDEGLCYCNSCVSALDFAICLGCKKIILFGVDHNTKNGKHHFWQLLYGKKNRPTANNPLIYDSWAKQKKVFEFSDKAYISLKKYADYKKAEVYNCSDITKVDAFDRISLDYAFKIIRE